MPYDFSKVDTLLGRNKVKIKKGVSYTYWEHSHQQDTLSMAYNTDTVRLFKLHLDLPPANSTIKIPLINNNYVSLIKTLPFALYITLCKPLFFDARNTMDQMASIENLFILAALLCFIWGSVKQRFLDPWPLYFLSIGLSVLLIIGITSPNIGAIERYRSLVIPFILMAALFVTNAQRFEQSRVFIFFKRSINT